MAKWKVVTTHNDGANIYEEVIEADNVMLDTSGNSMIFIKSHGVAIPTVGGQPPQNVGHIIRIKNMNYVVEAFDMAHSGKVQGMISN